MASTKAWAVVAGVGPGTVAVLARNPSSYQDLVEDITKSGGHCIGISTDCSDSNSVKNAFSQIKAELSKTNSKLTAAIYNTGGKFVRKPFLKLTEDEFTAGYHSSTKGAFLFSQAALPLLLEATDAQHPPTLIFTGATAAIKSSPMLSTFAHVSYAKRSLSQSLAKEFGPKGVHVAHTIIDGIIDIPRTKQWKVSDFPDDKISPEAIADAYWYLHTQPRTCWTQEIDVRPYVEKW
ncbi:putative short chain dehydrogenase reductase family [Phaeomoniella chlamydospora]|uniref:Putative short chain dehydrogenase reductase family n=1 Tax=Phaeomoniella chlamydospora TaxID=158046 RepID=A0A0G2DVI1_PHACM|nr:putative short chain dehydrogenase reductase family [Phaeomoniella chlamydospora]